MRVAEIYKFLWEGMNFAAFYITCLILLERRFCKKKTIVISGIITAGILLVQAGLLLLGQDTMLVLTMLLLTAFFPAVIGIHILSKNGIFQTVAVWGMGLLVSGILLLFKKNLQKLLWKNDTVFSDMGHLSKILIQTVCLLVVSALLLYVVFQYVRKPFKLYILHNQKDWLPIVFPCIMLLLIFSYFNNSPIDKTVSVLILMTALSVMTVIARLLVYEAKARRLRATEQALEAQMEIQRREYENICKKMELGRAYRHDMRHHLNVLGQLAGRENNVELTKYIDSLGGSLQEAEREPWCENTTVDAVLSSYIGRAKESGITVSAQVRIPAEMPFDPLELCSVLGNALENATKACLSHSDSEHCWIHLTAVLEDNRKFIVSVENPCDEEIPFDKAGFPVIKQQEGHGIGLKSIEAVARKHNGLFGCDCKDGVFRVTVVLFSSQAIVSVHGKEDKLKKAVTAPLLVIFVFCLTVNSLPVMAQTLERIPALGALTRVMNLKHYDIGWGATNFRVTLPKVELANIRDDFSGRIWSDMAKQKKSASKPGQTDISNETEEKTSEVLKETAQEKETDKIIAPSGTISWESGNGSEIPVMPSITVLLPNASKNEQKSVEPEINNENASSGDSDSDRPQQGLPGSDSGQTGEGESGPNSGLSGPVSTDSEVTLPGQDTAGPDLSEGVEDINQRMEEYIGQMRDEFLWYVARKYEGYVGMDIIYDVLRNDETLLLLRFDATLNAGGSGQYSRCFMLDKRTGQVQKLGDLFAESSDYIGVISTEILRQMTEAMENETATYFVPGYGWPESSCFQSIPEDQNFYINENNQLVIVFEEYVVGPGSQGMPEFVITTDIVGSILRQPSLLD